MSRQIAVILSIIFSLAFFNATGSHIVGGEATYKYLGDTTATLVIGGEAGVYTFHKYQINLAIYEDCFNGSPDAIASDNPAYLAIYDGAGNIIQLDTNVYSTSHITVPTNFSNACVSNIPPVCLYKRTFIKTYYLLPNDNGYILSYQKCCRNATVANIVDPGDSGSTYFCSIPPAPLINNSAVFTNYPPQIICMNEPLFYDNSATDADGDSLSYEFCTALSGANDPNQAKPIPLPPPYSQVTYVPPYTDLQPLSSSPTMQIDPVTGLITGTPNRLGRYLVTVCCNEWRNGKIINTVKREFQFVVTSCTKKVVADIPILSTDVNTYIVSCTDLSVNFENTSTGGFAYDWDFGVPYLDNDTSNQFQPTYTYPDTGTYIVKLIVNPASTCPDSISRFVKVYPKFHADFSDSGIFCPQAPIQFTDLSSTSIKPITSWAWNFGDGYTSTTENPVHSYSVSGTFNAVLISQNIKDCSDTVLKRVTIENFRPFAGDDTVIVKGERILFNATGGTEYSWTPSTNLNDTDTYNPTGFYPDTGQYVYMVHVTSSFGCAGYDTIHVTVVNQIEFFVPSGFTPNGDGRNDVFKPIAVGYRGLNYFRVFNRWGQEVYFSTSLETGWDGTFGGEKAEMGVYFWEVNYVDRFGKASFLKGDVTLIR